MSHSGLSGHRGPFFLGSLLVLLTRIFPEVLADFPNRHGASELIEAIGRRDRDAGASLSSRPGLRWLQDVLDRPGHVDVSTGAERSFGRSFDDAKNRLDATKDEIARGSFLLYRSRRRSPDEPSREEKEHAVIKRALAAQRGSNSYQNEGDASISRSIVGGQWPNPRSRVSPRRRHQRRFYGSTGPSDRREVCAMKILDLDGDVCGFVSQLAQLGKLLKRRNLLLGIMAERRINSGSSVPQTLALYIDGVIRDLLSTNAGMKRFIDHAVSGHERRIQRRRFRDSLHGGRGFNARKSADKSREAGIKNASTVEQLTTTAKSTSAETSTSSSTLTNAAANRFHGGDMSVGPEGSKINETVSEKVKSGPIENEHAAIALISRLFKPLEVPNSTDVTTNVPN